MFSKLMTMLNGSIKIINCIKLRLLKSKLFKHMCVVIGSQNPPLLLYAEVSWLIQGRAFTRLLKLHAETILDEP